MSIVVFSAPIQSGKTTALQQWCQQKVFVDGVLMPDVNGVRQFYHIANHLFIPVEVTNPETFNGLMIGVGKYHFSASAFASSNAILMNAWKQQPNWLIIDEVGKLELSGQGLFPSFFSILQSYNQFPSSTNLLIVVRDSLYETVVSTFRIGEHQLISSTTLLYQLK